MLTDKMKEILKNCGFTYYPEQHVDFKCDPILTDAWFDKEFTKYYPRLEEYTTHHLSIYNCGYFEVVSPCEKIDSGLPFDTIEDMNDLGIVLKRILGISIPE